MTLPLSSVQAGLILGLLVWTLPKVILPSFALLTSTEAGELEKLEIVSKLGFGKCRLSACAPNEEPVEV